MSLFRRISNLFSRSNVDQDIEVELRTHIEMRIDDNLRKGMPPDQARRDALLRFGNPTVVKERVASVDIALMLDNIWSDTHRALRQLRRSPGFAMVAILTLALGIGANTAIFSMVHAVLLQSLPVVNPQQLYSLSDGEARGETGALQGKFRLYSYPLYRVLRDNTSEFEQLAAFESATGSSMSVRRPGAKMPEQYFTELVSGNYFTMLGVHTVSGRPLEPSDDQPNAAPVAVMSYRIWREDFEANPGVVGTTLHVQGQPITIVGIMSPDFYGDSLSQNPTGLWMPLSMEPRFKQEGSLLNQWNQHWLMLMGRLKPGVGPEIVQQKLTAELQAWLRDQLIFDRQRDSLPRQHIEIFPASGGVSYLRSLYAQRLKLLMGLSALVLLIACANIANMLLARSASQHLRVAVQVALGASRARIVQQTLIQGLLLSFFGGTGALAVAFFVTRAILLLAFSGSRFVPVSSWPSLPVLAFTFAISLLTGLIFSVAPAIFSVRVIPAQPLRGASRSSGDASATPQRILVVLQAALALVLVVAAGLLIKSLQSLRHQHLGFETEGRLIVRIDKPLDLYKPQQLEGFYRNLSQRLERIPGVSSASFSGYSPMSHDGAGEPITIPGRPQIPKPEGGLWPDVNRVSPRYFETIGTHILKGRPIDETDTPTSRHVAVVNQAFADLYFPQEDPISKHFGILEAARSQDYEIVGVAEDAKYGNPHAPPYPTFFLPFLQNETYDDTAENSEQLGQNYLGSIQLRVTGQPQRYEDIVRRALADLNPNLTILYVRGFGDEVNLSFTQDLLLIRLTTLYGMLSLLLASIGLYGVSSYAVVRRTNEIGIRMALGADRSAVLRMFLRKALQMTAAGLLLGLPLSLIGGHVLRSQLFGVSAADPLVITFAAGVLASAAVIAAYLPACQAASIDPMQALRSE